jgi:methyl-accepting chemotaxis protein
MEDFNFFKGGNREYVGRWVGPYNDFKTQNKIISYISPIWRGNEFVGIVGFDLTIDSLFTDFINFDPSQSSYVFIAKNTGEIISTTDKLYVDLKIKKAENPSIFDSQVIKELKIPDFFKKDEGMSLISGEKIIAFSNIPSFAGKLILISPLGEIINTQKEKALEISQALATINLTINISMAALGVFIFLSSFYLIQKGLVKPIIIFRNAANNISNGKLDTRVSIKSQDEIGELATTFNNMASEMDQSHGDLEQKVTERTQKLDQKVKELEKFKEVTVDRELRMIELKKEIKRLEAKSQVGGEREKV